MHSAFGFSGRVGRVAYGYLTLGFSALVLGLAASSAAPFTQLMSAPWEVIGRFLDDVIQIGGSRAWLDLVLSLAVGLAIFWAFSVMTARRIRDIGQSPWWTVLVIFSGVVVPAMIVLSMIPSAGAPEQRRTGSFKTTAVPAD